MRAITSRANPSFRQLRALAQSARDRHEARRTLLDGPHLVRFYMERVGSPLLIAVSADATQDSEICALVDSARDVPVVLLAAALFSQIAPVESPSGVVASIDIPRSRTELPAGEFWVALERIQDPGNVGAIIRSAVGAGADAVLLSEGCADAWSPRALRAAMGATFAIDIRSGANLIEALARSSGRAIAAAARDGLPPHAIDLTGPVVMLFGNEGSGLSTRLVAAAAATVTIPLAHGFESLNVAAAAAVVMFERARQLATQSQPPVAGANRKRS
jgi:TrmH family RNA methyltransferase